jgi:hypothetical protein
MKKVVIVAMVLIVTTFLVNRKISFIRQKMSSITSDHTIYLLANIRIF